MGMKVIIYGHGLKSNHDVLARYEDIIQVSCTSYSVMLTFYNERAEAKHVEWTFAQGMSTYTAEVAS